MPRPSGCCSPLVAHRAVAPCPHQKGYQRTSQHPWLAERPVMHGRRSGGSASESRAYRRRCAPYLSPGPVTHREQEHPVIRRYDAQRPGAGDDLAQWIVLTGGGPRQPCPGRLKQPVRRSSCRRSGCTTSRCRWMGSAPARGKAWMLRSGMREPGCTSGSSRLVPSAPCRASPAAAPASTTLSPALGPRASAPRSWGGASSARTTAPGRTRSGTAGGETTRRSAPRSLSSPTICGPLSR